MGISTLYVLFKYIDRTLLTGNAVVLGYGVFFMDWDKEKQGDDGEVPFDGVSISG